MQFVQEVKQQILQSRYQAAKLVNKELLLLYHNIGQMLYEKIKQAKWGDKVLQNISVDLQKELPGLKGFSQRSLKKMRQFYAEYWQLPIRPLSTARLHSTSKRKGISDQIQKSEKEPLSTAQIESLILQAFFQISFTHHILLMTIKDVTERFFYMQQAAANYWTVNLLQYHIESDLYHQKGKLPNNFKITLPQKLAAHALDAFKDEYLLDFININPEDDERVLEQEIINNIKHFILSLGTGFSFIGNQHRLVVGEEDFFSDLLFYNRNLQCLVAIDLKRGKFKPEYAGKLNFYLNALDELEKLPHENNSIGIILCKEKNNKVVEYAFKSIDKSMGVATYKTSRQPPEPYRKILPNAEELKKLL
jgi:predicted nuclease of restriction endonuclease-like (RecB) superfamily